LKENSNAFLFVLHRINYKLDNNSPQITPLLLPSRGIILTLRKIKYLTMKERFKSNIEASTKGLV